jgi:2-oxoglutarate dehydrogenase E1 component
MVQAPIFHVNGEDPEAVIRVVELAMAFRTTFRKDVVIDLICYRRHGHNEGDDPSFTQPAMYARIKSKRSIRKMYTEKLVNRGDLTLVEAEKALEEYRGMLDHAFDDTRESAPAAVSIPEELVFVKPEAQFPTAISDKTLEQLLTRLTTFPDDFTVHPKLGKQIAGRRKMVEDNKIDWALGEAFAIGSLLLEGHPVRLSGQDSRRGTFSQRHLVLVDYKTSQPFNPLANISNDQAQMMVFDSLLSEYAVLGFEFGYSVIRKNALVMWEAQFGDFVNGAQIIIDQFISSSEDKWGQTSRVVMLLPHGFEGQGPEHSSARLERFLALCAEGNMRVTVPTTSAQYFHLLRNQAQREKSTPLIVLTPKSLLRADVAKSSKQDFLEGGFNVLLEEPNPPEKVNRLIFCSGKVAFDLIRYRDEKAIHDTAIIRLEQLYPFPFDQISALFDKYPDAKDIRWVQEEPRNMGAWNFTLARFREIIRPDQKLNYIGRLPSGSPASGSFKVHEAEQNLLVRQAFAR